MDVRPAAKVAAMSAAATLRVGEPAPLFIAPTPSNPSFHFGSVGGRYILLTFMPERGALWDLAAGFISRHRSLFDDDNLTAFPVLSDAASIAAARDQPPGLRWFLDPSGELRALFGVTMPCWILIDPTLRILAAHDLSDAEALFERLRGLGRAEDHAGAPTPAPVLIAPRIFEPNFCRQLIETYHARGGAISGVMREIDGMTVPIVDDFKKRRDASITDEALKSAIRARLARRLSPQIERALGFKATRLERYIVARYDAEEGGYFRPHRDNTTKGTAHRRFAVSINLNSEEHEGGDLRFPEYGRRTYRPPTGGAVVFSCSLLHEATPVTQGSRYAFLPFLYDDAGEQIRLENAQYLQAPTTP